MVSSAATTSESVPETEMSVNLIDGENATLRPTKIAIVAYAYGSTYPVCDHNDPTSGSYPHSTMRYTRTVRVYNYMISEIGMNACFVGILHFGFMDMNRILKCDILQMQFKKGGVKSSLLG